MKCDICGERPAVIFIQQVSKDSTLELHLCEQCAKERGVSTSDSRVDISLGNIFSGLMDGNQKGDGNTSVCPSCGISVMEIRKNHRAGCAECYSHFRSEIVSGLRSEGVTLSYEGTLPAKLESFNQEKNDPGYLRKELQQAIESENYELAAYYRDRLKAFGESK
ncbi:MAG TPA: UvrB/UvrC motif-containing protein [Treponemataceae bacterium]|nr:UvrB/UvrC motif-containing protein [Treponemataceae bacterium]